MTGIKSLYLIGSLRNPQVPKLANKCRKIGFDVFDSWYAASEDADDWLWHYEKEKGLSFKEALNDYAACHIFDFDRKHLDRCSAAVMLMKAGKSCHLELGYILGQGKPGFILFDKEPKRIDIMLKFATAICFSEKELLKCLKTLL